MAEITEEIREKVRQWVQQGCGLSELQAKLTEESGLSMTYMDVRFLVLELGLEIKERNARPAPSAAAPQDEPAADDAFAEPMDATGQDLGGVSLDISPIARPGSLVSGSVRFSDGMTADWSLDRLGQLALAPAKPDYRPSEADIQAFQAQFKQLMAQRGF